MRATLIKSLLSAENDQRKAAEVELKQARDVQPAELMSYLCESIKSPELDVSVFRANWQ